MESVLEHFMSETQQRITMNHCALIKLTFDEQEMSAMKKIQKFFNVRSISDFFSSLKK